MNPELKLQFQQKLHTLHIHAGLGVDENNVLKIEEITFDLARLAEKLTNEFYPTKKGAEDKPENDITEATKELEKVKPHKPESK